MFEVLHIPLSHTIRGRGAHWSKRVLNVIFLQEVLKHHTHELSAVVHNHMFWETECGKQLTELRDGTRG